MYEVKPFAFLFEQAKGASLTTDGINPLSLKPSSVHQQVPIIIGSNHAVSQFTA
jgi:fructose-1,6-bisphosphatase